jgi:CTP:molybdopterin cytidylyltransferase MocA
MAGRSKSVTTVVKLGVKYGPVAYEAIKHGKEPAREFAQRQLARLNARKQALGHAEGLLDGSVMPVWRDDQQVWIVFNGDQPIASHPTVDTPLQQLIAGYDLAKRIRPTHDQRPKANPLKALRSRR